MYGLDMDKPIAFKHSSLRYFSEGECHITRIGEDNVLVMIFKGILRFSEDGVEYEIHPGEYHIQKVGSYQTGDIPSDSPEYLYVHFDCEWGDSDKTLPKQGIFDYKEAKKAMEELDRMSHGSRSYIRKTAKFYEILLMLYKREKTINMAREIAEFIKRRNLNEMSLEMICEEFNFSKNHIINVFKKEFGVTPVKYINNVKLKRAEYLLEATSKSIEDISYESGFNDYSHFYKLFCREKGMSPAQWRSRKHMSPAGI